MKILSVITSMQKAAGTSVFCGEVSNGLVALGHEVVIAVAIMDSCDCYPLDTRIKLMPIVSLLKDSTRRTCSTWVNFDLVHLHALWSPLLHKVAKWAQKNKIPVVWSPHGMLTPWAMHNKWWKKYLAWWLYQRKDLLKADLLHVTARSEVEDVRRLGLQNNIVVAPLGVMINSRVENVARVDEKKVLLFVSRVQRKKGLVNLLKAWAQLKATGSKWSNNWKVRIVGPDQEGHTAELKSLCQKLGVAQDVEFVGPKYGENLQLEYATADLFVLPTHSENFGSVVIEALAHSVPVICTKGAPWQELETSKCGWWIDIGVQPLVNALRTALSLSDGERRDMGKCGRKMVEEKYTWNAVVRAMEEGYKEVLNGMS